MGQPTKSFLTLPIAALCVATIVVVLASLYVGAREVDRVALAGQQTTIAQAVNQHGLAHARELRLMTVWDEAHDNVSAVNLDWMDKYLGGYLNEVLGYDRLYVISGDDKPLYGSIGGAKGTLGMPLPPSVEKLVRAIRASKPQVPADHIQATQVSLDNGKTVEHRSIVDVLPIDGKPASVIASTVLPDHGSLREGSEKPSLIIAMTNLDESEIERIGNDFGFRGLHWVQDSTRPGYDSADIRSIDGASVGSLAWQEHRPGREFLSRAAPGLMLALLPIAAIAYLLLAWGNRQVKQLMESEAHAKRAARTDSLTELPNLVALRENFERLLDEAKRGGSTLAVVSIDIDRFKSINDAFGHAVGDAVLKACAVRLKKMMPENGCLSRPDGDSFVMLAPAVDAPAAAELTSDMIAALSEPFDLDSGTRVFIAVSIGYALAPLDGVTVGELTRRAELALRKAKADAEGEAVGFTRDMDAEVTFRLMLETALRAAIADGSIDVMYQPVMDASGQRVLGVEALARWTDSDLGPISPVVFIPLAEETGLIQHIGELVLRRAVEDCKAWPGVLVAVNVSASQIHHGDIVEVVREALEDSQLPPERLEIEITESVLLADEKRANEQMRGLQSLGVRIALDDFGTGYSSLQYLSRFGFDKLKIDRSFIDGAGDPAGSSVVLASIIRLGQDLKMTITAEGVETEAQRRWLQTSGCNELQGYLFSRPLTRADMSAFIASRRAEAKAVAS